MPPLKLLILGVSIPILLSCSNDTDVSTSYELIEDQASSGKDSSSSGKDSSSSTTKTSSSSTKNSSSGETASSSSLESSSSQKTSSSSTSEPTNDFSITCTPTEPTVNLEDDVHWKLSSYDLPAVEIAAATFSWTFDDGTPKTASSSDAYVSYTTPGKKTATLTVSTKKSGTATTSCSVIIPSNPITDCQCTAEKRSIDIKTGGNAKWQISGCKSSKDIINYTWEGAGVAGNGESATATFTNKGDILAPTVTVTNEEYGIAKVSCPAVTATDSDTPDYLLDFNDSFSTERIKVPSGACIQIHGSWSTQYFTPKLNVTCEYSSSTYDFVMKLSHEDKNIDCLGSLFSRCSISIGTVSLGENDFGEVCVTISPEDGTLASCMLEL